MKIFCILLLCFSSMTQALLLDQSTFASQSLENHIAVYYGDNRDSIESIRQLAPAAFSPLKNHLLSLDNGQILWLRFSIDNNGPKELRYLDLGTKLINHAVLYSIVGNSITSFEAGLRQRQVTKELHSPSTLIPIELQAQTRNVYYLSLSSVFTTSIDPYLVKPAAISDLHSEESSFAYLIMGILLGGAIYLFLISAIIEQRLEIGYFLAFVASSLAVIFSLHQHLHLWVLAAGTCFSAVFISLQSLNAILFILFFIHLFDIKTQYRKNYYALMVFIAIYVLLIASSWLPANRFVHSGFNLATHLCLFYIFSQCVLFWRRKIPLAVYFLAALSIFGLLKSYDFLSQMNYLPDFSLSPLHYAIANCIIVMVYTSYMAQNVNRAKKIQTATLASASEALARSQAKNEFLAKMSHEIRTPMNGVLGMLQLIKETSLSDVQKNYLSVIEQSGHTLMTVINDVLDYSKIEAGKLHLDNSVFHLEQLLNNTTALFQPQAADKNIQLLVNIHSDVPQQLVGDSTRLTQIIANLISNAVKFTHQGEIQLSVQRLYARDDKIVELRFTVSDSGIGIDQARIDNLFSAFEQADSSTTRMYGGTGLGLTICQQLVELMGGEIFITSKLGAGSSFWFDIPLTIANTLTLHSSADQQLLAGKRLFIAQSQDSYNQSLLSRAEDWQMHVRHSNRDLEQCLAMIINAAEHGQAFDLIFMNYQTGPALQTFINGLREHSKTANTACIFALNNATDSQVKPFENVYFYHKTSNISSWQSIFKQVLDTTINHETPKVAPPTEAISFNGNCILVAEDNPINQQVICSILSKLKIDYILANNGLEAYNRYRTSRHKIDMILMDCEMPLMDGYDATDEIRKFEQQYRCERMPIVALTAHALHDHRSKSLQHGMDDYLTKPVQMAELIQVFSIYLRVPH